MITFLPLVMAQLISLSTCRERWFETHPPRDPVTTEEHEIINLEQGFLIEPEDMENPPRRVSNDGRHIQDLPPDCR